MCFISELKQNKKKRLKKKIANHVIFVMSNSFVMLNEMLLDAKAGFSDQLDEDICFVSRRSEEVKLDSSLFEPSLSLCISKLRLLIYNVDVFVILLSLITFCFKFTVFYHLSYYYFYQSQGRAPASLVQIRRAFMKKKKKKP